MCPRGGRLVGRRPLPPLDELQPVAMQENRWNLGAFEPVSKAEAAEAAGLPAGAGRSPPASVAPPMPAAAAGAPSPAISDPIDGLAAAPVAAAPAVPGVDVPRFVGGGLRRMEVPLTYPVEFAGRVWEAIPLYRPTAREVGDYFEALKRIGPDDWLHFPIYREADGTPVPSAVIDYLDPDDSEAVTKASADFLCVRLKRLQEIQSSTSSTL